MAVMIDRILGPDGRIEKGRKAPSVDDETLISMYRVMVLNRRIDERMTRLQRQGRIGFHIGSTGEEASIVGSAIAVRETDWILPCYRELAAALIRGLPLYDFFCQMYGNDDDVIRGRQMPNHYSFREKRYGSISSPVGTQIPQAVGLAMGLKIQKKDDIVLAYFGDGATSGGDFHVAANFAGVFQAPIVLLCRNNQWAISMPGEMQTASESIAIKAQAYGYEGFRVDGNDVLAVYEATRKAAERARSGAGPTLIEAVTYRQGAHSTSDDPRAYRDDDEVKKWAERDPLRRMRIFLQRRKLWDDDKDSELVESFDLEIAQTLKKAESVGPPSPDTIFEDVFDSIPWHLEEQRQELSRAEESS